MCSNGCGGCPGKSAVPVPPDLDRYAFAPLPAGSSSSSPATVAGIAPAPIAQASRTFSGGHLLLAILLGMALGRRAR